MEEYSATTSETDHARSCGTADAGGESEPHRGALQAVLQPLLPASVSSDEDTVTLQGGDSQADESNSTSRMPDNIHSPQPLVAHVTESTASFKRSSAASEALWRPTYLRRWVLSAFSVTFFMMIALLEVLHVLSSRNGGIAKGYNKDHYLWTYGPTALLTLIAALFNRVEYQAKLMAPWERLAKHPAPGEEILLLDYISPLQPVAMYTSLKNKDFAVAASTTISLVIKILIVLSSGLITLSRIPVHYASMPMEVQNAFLDDNSPFRVGNHLPYYVMQGVIGGSSYPPGISEEFAYQSVQSRLPATAQYQVVVDGLATNLHCEIANVDVDSTFTDTDPSWGTSFPNLTVRSPGCDAFSPLTSPSVGSGQVTFGAFSVVQCDGTTDHAGERMVVIVGLEEWYVDETLPTDDIGSRDNLRGRLVKSAQILCTPQYEINKVRVTQAGSEVQSVMLTGNSLNRTLGHVRPWDFTNTFFSTGDFGSAYGEDLDGWRNFNIRQQSVKVDDFMYNALETQAPSDIDVSMLFDPIFIQSIATRYYRQIGAIIAKQILMEPASLNITGSAMIMEDRLVAREWAVQWMAALISTCLILSLITALTIPKYGTLHRSPSTLSEIAALIARSPDVLERLRDSGDADSKTLRLQLHGSAFQSEVIHRQLKSNGLSLSQRYLVIKDVVPAGTGTPARNFHQSESAHSHPWILHPASRLALGLVLIALMITLEVLLDQSRSHEGIGNVGDNSYIHYTWTSLPALVFGGLAMVFSSMDFTIRSLAPYFNLSDMITGDFFRTLDFLDMSVPSAILKEAKLRNFGALATTSKLLFASFFTIFSGSLFQSVYFSSTHITHLRANSSFSSANTAADYTPALILLSNWSYPSFTYEDLAFPQFLPDTALMANDFSNGASSSIEAVVPALRSHLECRMYNKSTIHVEIGRTGSEGLVEIEEEGEEHNPWSIDLRLNTSYFGQVWTGYSNSVFLWGKTNLSNTSHVGHIAAMGCNQSIEVVDVETTFIGADLAIDVDNPPRVLPNTERTLSVPIELESFLYGSGYQGIPRISEDEGLSRFYTVLTQSRWAIPLSMFGGGSDDAVAAAIKFQHGIFFAQALNKGRAPATETNATLTLEQVLAGENDASRTYEATVVDKTGRQRVVQDAISTRVLEALLLVTLILLGVGWVWLPKTNALPKRSPTTIASAVALLAGGNLEEWVHEMDKDTTGAFGGQGTTVRFWMGWGNVPDEEGILMGNENENGISRFGIFAVKADQNGENPLGGLSRAT